LIEEGDIINIDIPQRRIDINLSCEVLERRRKNWSLPGSTELKKGSLLERYRRLVGTAIGGSIFE